MDAVNISIHALREEGDKSIPGNGLPYQNFNPRPPRGGRLSSSGTNDKQVMISIHALREEGDPLYSVPGLYKL